MTIGSHGGSKGKGFLPLFVGMAPAGSGSCYEGSEDTFGSLEIGQGHRSSFSRHDHSKHLDGARWRRIQGKYVFQHTKSR